MMIRFGSPCLNTEPEAELEPTLGGTMIPAGTTYPYYAPRTVFNNGMELESNMLYFAQRDC